MKKKKIPSKLPKSLYQYFWEVDPKKVNPYKSPHYVIHRLLDKGKKDAFQFIINHFPHDLILETVKKRRGFSPQTANFWALYFRIPRKEVVCLNREFLGKHVKLWPY